MLYNMAEKESTDITNKNTNRLNTGEETSMDTGHKAKKKKFKNFTKLKVG